MPKTTVNLPPLHIEQIVWIPAGLEYPDATMSVLGYNPEWSEPIWPCYYDVDEHDRVTWYCADAMPIVAPTHWAEFPEGPVL